MATVEQEAPPLVAGDRLDRAEFMRRWEMNPKITRAELIGGIVYMPSPLRVDHGGTDLDVRGWLMHYKAYTPGTEGGSNVTSYLLDDAPQADAHLRLIPECGGTSWVNEDDYLEGPPELFAEICLSSTSYDLHQKKDLYEEAGVKEYLAVLVREQEIRWHILMGGRYRLLPSDAKGIWRSRVFPGLWLDGAAILAGNARKVLAVLDRGLRSPEHQKFVAKLARRKH